MNIQSSIRRIKQADKEKTQIMSRLNSSKQNYNSGQHLPPGISDSSFSTDRRESLNQHLRRAAFQEERDQFLQYINKHDSDKDSDNSQEKKKMEIRKRLLARCERSYSEGDTSRDNKVRNRLSEDEDNTSDRDYSSMRRQSVSSQDLQDKTKPKKKKKQSNSASKVMEIDNAAEDVKQEQFVQNQKVSGLKIADPLVSKVYSQRNTAQSMVIAEDNISPSNSKYQLPHLGTMVGNKKAVYFELPKSKRSQNSHNQFNVNQNNYSQNPQSRFGDTLQTRAFGDMIDGEMQNTNNINMIGQSFNNSPRIGKERQDRETTFEEVKRAQSSLVIDRLNNQIGALIANSQNITNFHEDTKEIHSEGRSSIGTISSADEHDMELLFSGNHTYQFQAVQYIRQKAMEAQAKEQAQDKLRRKQKSILQKIKRCFGCGGQEQQKKSIIKGVSTAFAKFKRTKLDRRKLMSLGRSNTFHPKTSATDYNDGSNGKKGYQSEPDGTQGKKSHWDGNAESKNQIRRTASETHMTKGGDKDDRNLQSLDEIRKGFDKIKSGEEQAVDDEKEACSDEHVNANHDTDPDVDGIDPQEGCRQKFSRNYMITPGSRKLKYFHLIVSLTLYIDFFMTGFILGNYNFHVQFNEGLDPDFLKHKSVYLVIFIIQVTDIMLTFLKITTVDVRQVNDIFDVSRNYIIGMFLQDVIAVIPWSFIRPQLIFLRYLKMRKFGVYQSYIDEILSEMIASYLNNEQVKKVIDAFRLVVQVTFVSHIFANLWILIGLIQKEKEMGWIIALTVKNIQKADFFSLYCTSMYWVITSFSSVGYGDISGSTDYEYIFQMIVEMVGIGFFGWMIGTIQNLIQGFKEKNQSDEQQELIDLWLIQLDKARKQVILPKSIFSGVRDFYSQQFKFDASIVYKDKSFGDNYSFFEQLKPRLQRSVLDAIFQNFTVTFHHIFQDCGTEFQREIFYSAQFKFYSSDSENADANPDFLKDVVPSAIIEQEKKSKNVYFILQGRVHLMNKTGMYEYGAIQEGGYFGDISALLDQPNEYSYYYNYYSNKMLIMLALDAKEFISLCHKHPVAHEILYERAHKRREMFENYKTVTLLKFMKCIKKEPSVVSWYAGQQLWKQQIQSDEPPRDERGYRLKLSLIEALVNQYNYNRWIRKREIQNQLENQYEHYTSAFGASLTKTLFCGTYDEASCFKRKLTKKQFQKLRQLEFKRYKEQAMKVDVIIEQKKKAQAIALQQERERQKQGKKGTTHSCGSPNNQHADSFQGNDPGPTSAMASLIGRKQPTPQDSQLMAIQIQGRNNSNVASTDGVATEANANAGNSQPRAEIINNSQQLGDNNSNAKPQYESERGTMITGIQGNPAGAPAAGPTDSANINNQPEGGDAQNEGGSSEGAARSEQAYQQAGKNRKRGLVSFDLMERQLRRGGKAPTRAKSTTSQRRSNKFSTQRAGHQPTDSDRQRVNKGTRSLNKGSRQGNPDHQQFLSLVSSKLYIPSNADAGSTPVGSVPSGEREIEAIMIVDQTRENAAAANGEYRWQDTRPSPPDQQGIPTKSISFSIEGGSHEESPAKLQSIKKTRNLQLSNDDPLTGTFGSYVNKSGVREAQVPAPTAQQIPVKKPPLHQGALKRIGAGESYVGNPLDHGAPLLSNDKDDKHREARALGHNAQQVKRQGQYGGDGQQQSPMNLSYAKDGANAEGLDLRLQQRINSSGGADGQGKGLNPAPGIGKPKAVNSISFRDFGEVNVSPVAINVQYNGLKVDDQVIKKRPSAQSKNTLGQVAASEDSFARAALTIQQSEGPARIRVQKGDRKVQSVEVNKDSFAGSEGPSQDSADSDAPDGVRPLYNGPTQADQASFGKLGAEGKRPLQKSKTGPSADSAEAAEALKQEQEAATRITEANYRHSTVEQIKAKLEENENTIKKLLREYFQIRQKEKVNNMLNIFRKAPKKGPNAGQPKGKPSAPAKEGEDKADIDMIIEEYLNLNQITQGLFSGQAGNKEAAAQDRGSNEEQKKSAVIKMNSIDTAQTQRQEELQNAGFKRTKDQYVSQIYEQVKKFAAHFNAKVDETQEYLNSKILEKLEIVYDDFDKLPDSNKEFFVRKLQERQAKDKCALNGRSRQKRPLPN